LSLGSKLSVPTEFWSRLGGVVCFHEGLGASASVVSQTPPPDAPAQTRHFFSEHFGSTRSAVIRLPGLLVAPENDVTPGWVPLILGASSFHWLLQRNDRECALRSLASRFAIRVKVCFARATTACGIELAGYVRAACRYAS